MLNVISNDVRRNIALGFKIGLEMPEMVITDTRGVENDPDYDVRDRGMALKIPSDIEFDYSILWTGEEFKNPVLFINDRTLLAGGMGAELPANLVTAIPARIHFVKQQKALAETIREYDRHFRGWVTVRMNYHEDTLYYNHISFELLPDYYHCLQSLYGYDNADYFLLDYRDGKLPEPQGMAVSLRLYTYPYDPAENIAAVIPWLERLDLKETEDSFIKVRYNPKVHIKDAWEGLYKELPIRSMAHAGIVFNPGGSEKARKVYAALQKGRVIKGYKKW